MDTLYPSTMLFRARVDVDMQGRLAVTVVDALVPDIASGEESRLSRTELRPLLDRIASERGSALRVEIHEPDGKVFTDFHTTEPAPDTGAPTPAVTSPANAEDPIARHTRLSAHLGTGDVTGTGFSSGEKVTVAGVIYRRAAEADGRIELLL